MREQETHQPLPVFLDCRAVLFDLDGVLVESSGSVERAWMQWVERHGLDIPDIVERAHGRRTIDTVRELAPSLDADDEVRWLEATEVADTIGLRVVPGADAALGALVESERAVVTSGGPTLARTRLSHVGLPIPRILVTAADVRFGKPSPEGYQLAAARLGVDPSDCVVIEDTPPGIAAGRAAGAKVIGVATTFRAEALGESDVVLTSLADLRVTRVDGMLRLMVRPLAADTDAA
jgi:mannitol-1-/sugar-/sorbitol-6-phosphatase